MQLFSLFLEEFVIKIFVAKASRHAVDVFFLSLCKLLADLTRRHLPLNLLDSLLLGCPLILHGLQCCLNSVRNDVNVAVIVFLDTNRVSRAGCSLENFLNVNFTLAVVHRNGEVSKHDLRLRLFNHHVCLDFLSCLRT